MIVPCITFSLLVIAIVPFHRLTHPCRIDCTFVSREKYNNNTNTMTFKVKKSENCTSRNNNVIFEK